MAAESAVIMNRGGIEKFSSIPHGHFAAGAADSVSQEVGRFLQFKRAGQTMDVCTVGFDLLRRKAEPKMQMRFPEAAARVT